jgi:hypothetical protein
MNLVNSVLTWDWGTFVDGATHLVLPAAALATIPWRSSPA